MSQFFEVNSENPQPRLLRQAGDIIRKGGVIAYPTDSAYALGCHIGDKKAVERIRRIRRLTDKHNFTLMCRDLADISLYAKVDNSLYRLLKAHTPGAYTFILHASRQVPRLLLHPKRRSIGIRIPDCNVTQALLAELGEPLLSSSLILPGEDSPLTEPWDIRERLEHELDLVIDGGQSSLEPSTVVDLRSGAAEVLRYGKGDPAPFVDGTIE